MRKIIISIDIPYIKFDYNNIREKCDELIIWNYNDYPVNNIESIKYLDRKDLLSDFLLISNNVQHINMVIESMCNFLEKRTSSANIYMPINNLLLDLYGFSNIKYNDNINKFYSIELEEKFMLPYCIMVEAGCVIQDDKYNNPISLLDCIKKNHFELIYNYCIEIQDVFINNIVKEIYDDYYKDLMCFWGMNLCKDYNRKSILYLIHADFHKDACNNIGGTQFHLKDLVSNVKNKYNVYVISSDNGGLRCSFYMNNIEISFIINKGKKNINKMFDNENKEIIETLIDYFSINIVHIHHLLGLGEDIVQILENKKIPFLLTCHDYYYICPVIKMSCNDKYDASKCNECLQMNCTSNIRSEIWLEKHKEIFSKSHQIIFPSYSCKDVYTSEFTNIENKSCVIEHGINNRFQYKGKYITNNKILKIACIGNITKEKGAELILGISSICQNIEIHIWGGISDQELQKSDKIIKHGWYEQEDIVNILRENNIDVILLLSTLKETFSYTLSEAILARIPVIVSGLGALKSRVAFYKCGWILSSDPSAHEIKLCLDNIIENKSEYNKIIDNINEINLPSIREMSNQYEKMYDMYATIRCLDLEKKYIETFIDKYFMNKNNCNKLFEENKILREKIITIENTKGWKILNVLRKIRNYFH